jgi:ABC-type transport system substrate-binding protein
MQALATPYFAIFKDSKSGPIGTGSYFLKKNETGHVLAIHRHKPSSNAIGPEVIEFLPESDDNKRMKLVQNGEVDLIEWPNWSGAPPTRYSQYPINHLQTAILLANRKILGKSACDELMLVSDEIKERHLFGLRRIQIGVPLFWKIFSDRSETTPYRTSWISTEHPREILFSQSASVYQESDRKALAQSLKSKHFSVTFKEVPYSDFVTRLKSGQFDFALAGFLPDYLDPDALLYPMLHSGELFNYTRYSNPKIDALLEKARKLDDSVGRAQLYKEAFSFTSRECFMNVLGSQPSKVLLRKNWSAPIIGALGLHTLDLSTLKQEVENGK